MIHDMGIIRTTLSISALDAPDHLRELHDVRVDLVRRELIPAGPVPVAVAA